MTDTDTDTDNSRQPAYVSYPSFEGFLDWYRDNGPAEITVDGMSGYANQASASQLMVGLRSLGLVVDNVAQDHLGDLAGSEGERRQGLMESLLRDAYGSDFISALDNMSLEEVEVELRQLGTTDSTHKRALPFFINAAKAAGLAMQPEVSKRARKRTAKVAAPPTQAALPEADEAPAPAAKPKRSRKARVVQPQMDAVLPGPPIPIQPERAEYRALQAILGTLPADACWNAAQRMRWETAFTAVLNLETWIVDGS